MKPKPTTLAAMTTELQRVGACWYMTLDQPFIAPGDGIGATPTYQILPDALWPRASTVKRFRTLAEVNHWIAEEWKAQRREEARARREG